MRADRRAAPRPRAGVRMQPGLPHARSAQVRAPDGVVPRIDRATMRLHPPVGDADGGGGGSAAQAWPEFPARCEACGGRLRPAVLLFDDADGARSGGTAPIGTGAGGGFS